MQRTASSERLSHIPGYQILRRLSQNQFSITYLAKQTDSERKVMLKAFAPHVSQRPDFNTRFLQGCEALREWRHPNIVQLYEGGVHRGAHYLSLEYVSGGTRIDELSLEQPRHVLRWIADLARAVQYADSKGFSHGCIEAEAVLVHREQRVMLTGFEQQLLDITPAPGAAHYLSPERQQGESPGVSSDIYSLGMLLYCLLVRRAPTAADVAAGAELKQVGFGVPSLPGNLLVLQPLVNRTLAPEWERRFSSAAGLADTIDAVTDEDIEAIHLATPHYLANIKGPPRELGASWMTVSEETHAPPILTDAIPTRPSVRTRPQLIDNKPRRTGVWMGLGAVVVLATSVIVFRDRLPPPAELLAKAGDEAQKAVQWLEQVTGTPPEPAVLDPVVVAPEPVADEGFDQSGMTFIDERENVAELMSSSNDEPLVSDPEPGAGLADESALSVASPSAPSSAISSPMTEEAARYTAENTRQSYDYVAEGDRLLAEDALTLPQEANALTAYQHALALDPRNAEAWAGLQKIVTRYVQLAEARVAVGDWSGAAEFVRRGLGVDAKHPDLLALQSRLSVETNVPSASIEDVERLGGLARVQMVKENYVTPEGEGAFDYYSRLLFMAPDNAEARSGLARIERELAGEIELLVNRNRFDQARILLATAKDHFPTSQRLYNLTLALEAAAQSEQDRRASVQHFGR